ncbi:MAG: SUMF1/EgtB/PvdO family nonheme iron enzyme [Spirochaetia bacterium]
MARRRIASFLLSLLACASLAAQEGSRGLAVVKGTGSIEGLKGNAGKRYAVCIGINDFEDKEIHALRKARNDAKSLGEALKGNGQFDNVQVMTDDIDPRHDPQGSYPRLANIRAKLKYLSGFITPDDLVVLSFSGHGLSNEAGDGYLVMADTRRSDVFGTSLPVKEIIAWLQKTKVRKSLLLIDACRETISETASRGLTDDVHLRAQQYERAEVSAVFYATKTGWFSFEDPNSDYGVFTKFLLEGIKGKADYQTGNRDGIVTFSELARYVQDEVASYALEQNLMQRPYTKINGESFGDLALSTYSASVDPATRSEAGAAAQEQAAAGVGAASIYSNVEGQVVLDEKPLGTVGKGRRLPVDDLPAGKHFLRITHAYGVLEKELVIRDGWRTNVVNMVIANDREPQQVGGVPFIFVKGSASVPSFWMGQSEITFGQFASFVRRTGYKAQGGWEQYYKPAYDWYPVIDVTWDDCMAYVQWFARTFKAGASLPSLAQWRYAAGGKFGTAYPWGDDWDASFCHNADSSAPGALPVAGENGPVQVQYFLMDMTLDGLTHMAGNVSQWCTDQKKSSDGSILLAAAAGGSWKLSKPKYFASDYSSFKPVTNSDEDLGFRLVMPAE